MGQPMENASLLNQTHRIFFMTKAASHFPSIVGIVGNVQIETFLCDCARDALAPLVEAVGLAI
jgi:hypothetical protein